MTTSLLQHDVLPFSGHSGFAAVALEVVRDALDRGAVPVVIATTPDIAAVRSTLGAHAAAVVGVDMSVVGRNPGRLIPVLARIVDEAAPREVACVTELVRRDHQAELVDEVRLHEAMLALPPFRAWNCTMVCAYDASLDADVVASIEAAHERGESDPLDRVERVRAEALPMRPQDSQELGVDRTTLSALRGFVQQRAVASGLDSERVDDLVYAVNEVVTNSLCHGEGRARVSFWGEPGSVVVEVRDRGWIRDPLAGRIAPRPDGTNGRGLWLVNQLCDLVQVRSSPAGTAVRLHIDVD